MSNQLQQIVDHLNKKYEHYYIKKEMLPNFAQGILSLHQNPKINEDQFEISYKAFSPIFIKSITIHNKKVQHKQLNGDNTALLMENFIRWGYEYDKTKNSNMRYRKWKTIVEDIFHDKITSPSATKDFLTIIGDKDIKNYSDQALKFILSEKVFIVNEYHSNPDRLSKFLFNIHKVNADLTSSPEKIKHLINYDNRLVEQLFTKTINTPVENSRVIHTKTIGGNFAWISGNKQIDEKIIKALLNNTDNIHQYVNVHDMNKHSIAVWHTLIKKTNDNIVDLAFYAKNTKNNKEQDWIPEYKQYLALKNDLQNIYPDANPIIIKKTAIALRDNMPENDGILNVLSYHLINENWKPEILYTDDWKEIEQLWSSEKKIFNLKHTNFDRVVKTVKKYNSPEEQFKRQQRYEERQAARDPFKRMLTKL